MITLLLILTVISRVFYKRSLMATLAEVFLRLTEKRYTDKELYALLKKKRSEKEQPYFPPKSLLRKVIVSEKIYGGMQVFYLDTNQKSNRAVIYLHGGAYFRKPRRWHWKMLRKICINTGVTVIAPIYPKVPYRTCEYAYNALTDFYLNVKSRYSKIILAGDSSGGGFALGLTEHLIKLGITLPDQLILLSPWVDVTLSDPDVEKYEKTDPIVFPENVRILGKEWAGNLKLDDYRVSPLFGDMKGIKSAHIFCGTREVLYPENVKLYQKLLKSGTDITFYQGKGLNHVYPVFPIPEAKTARKKIENIIKRTAK